MDIISESSESSPTLSVSTYSRNDKNDDKYGYNTGYRHGGDKDADYWRRKYLEEKEKKSGDGKSMTMNKKYGKNTTPDGGSGNGQSIEEIEFGSGNGQNKEEERFGPLGHKSGYRILGGKEDIKEEDEMIESTPDIDGMKKLTDSMKTLKEEMGGEASTEDKKDEPKVDPVREEMESGQDETEEPKNEDNENNDEELFDGDKDVESKYGEDKTEKYGDDNNHSKRYDDEDKQETGYRTGKITKGDSDSSEGVTKYPELEQDYTEANNYV